MSSQGPATQSPIESALAALRVQFAARFEQSQTEQALRDENAKILGKKGELTAVLALMRNVPAADKAAVGAKVNAFKRGEAPKK